MTVTIVAALAGILVGAHIQRQIQKKEDDVFESVTKGYTDYFDYKLDYFANSSKAE